MFITYEMYFLIVSVLTVASSGAIVATMRYCMDWRMFPHVCLIMTPHILLAIIPIVFIVFYESLMWGRIKVGEYNALSEKWSLFVCSLVLIGTVVVFITLSALYSPIFIIPIFSLIYPFKLLKNDDAEYKMKKTVKHINAEER